MVDAKIQREHPEIQIFWPPNIALRKFSTPQNRHSSPYIWAFSRIFHTRKKWNRDITFYFLPIHKTYEAAAFGLIQNVTALTHIFATEP